MGDWTYEIWWTLRVEGVVERQDVIGALYHETDSLGSDFSLNELKDRGKVNGPVIQELESEGGVTKGRVGLRCDLDLERAAELAAALETIDEIGPCKADVSVNRIGPASEGKREMIRERAAEILEDLNEGEDVTA